MHAEIITIGDELLIGQVVDTNSAWLAQILNKYNIRVQRIYTVADRKEEIVSGLSLAMENSDLVIITGGLGPTKDDITKKTLAEYFGMGWRTDKDVLTQLEVFFKNRGRNVLEINRQQAELPDGCITLHNEWGTAPGMWFEKNGKVVISLPGVPYEMKNLFEKKALPEIRKRFKGQNLYHKVLVTFNIPESELAMKIADIEDELPENIKLAFLPNLNVVRLRLTGTGNGEGDDIYKEVDGFANRIKERVGEACVAEKDATLAEIIFEILISEKKTLSVAESCTGGYISHLLTMLPGASKIFVGSVISYSNSVKHHQLGVESVLFETVGAVSEPVVSQMAEGVRDRLKTDYSIAVSGIAGPGGGTLDKPVGTVVVGVCGPSGTQVLQCRFTGDRMNIIGRSANMAFDLLRRSVLDDRKK